MPAKEDFLKLKGNINHSVCRWCYNEFSLDTLCSEAKKIGIKSIDLIGPTEFEVLHKHELECAMVQNLPKPYGIENGFNRKEHHKDLQKIYADLIPQTARAGFKNVICLSGNRKGLSDEEGLKNCVEGIKPLMEIAGKYHITLVMELLNSRVDHPDYQCDHTAWGVELCNRINHPNFRLLYDIYHMQIMEGDIIATIQKYHPYIAHYHTGGVPGRHEIDDTQELYYPAIMEAIVETGFRGFVAQEFIPLGDPLKSLKDAILICDV